MRVLTPRWCVALAVVALAACSSDDEPPITQPVVTDPCAATTPITLGQSLTGSLSLDDCVEGGTGGFHTDRWSFSLPQRTNVRIDMTSNAFDTFLELRSSAGAVITRNDDYNGLNSTILATLDAGEYVIVTRAYSPGSVGSYRLTLSEGPDCSPLGQLELGTAVSGTITTTDCVWEYGSYLDNWTFENPVEQWVRVDMTSPDMDEVVLIRDSQGYVFAGGDWGGPAGHARIETLLPAGTWTVSATAVNPMDRGSYDLVVDVRPPCTPGTALVIGESVQGEIGGDDCLFDGWMPADSFALELDVERTLEIHLKASEFEPIVIVRTAGGQDLYVGFDTAQTGNARIRETFEAGSYSVIVFGNGYPVVSGTYQLTVTEVICSEAVPVDFGSTVEGTLDPTDCRRANGAFQEPWALVLDAETDVRIEMISAEVDAYLVLRDADGQVIAFDDDGGDAGLDARIDATLAAGTYEIQASSFSADDQGAYQLTVGSPPAAPAGPATVARTDDEPSKPGVIVRDAAATLRALLDEWKDRASFWLHTEGWKDRV